MEELKFSIMSNDVRIVPDVVEKKVSGKDYVFYGEENKFPQYVWNLYLKSAILQGIVNGTCDFVSGNGIISNLPITQMNSDGDELEDLIRKISMDYNIFGGFCFQVIKDYNGAIKELYWLDMQNIRLNEEGDKAYYCEKWNQYGAKAIEYEVWNPKKNQSNFVVYYKGHISRGLYPVPRFIGALAAIETSTEIGKFHLNNILNNLTSSAIINFNNGEPSEEQKKMIEKKLNDKFSGANNAGKNMIVFNNNKDSAVTVERLSEDNFDKKFETLAKSTREEIFISCRATPALFGLNPENNGFSKSEFLESFDLYNKTVVRPIQNDIKRVFDKLFNVDNSIIFNKFELEDSENKFIA
jgi:capsid portal protein